MVCLAADLYHHHCSFRPSGPSLLPVTFTQTPSIRIKQRGVSSFYPFKINCGHATSFYAKNFHSCSFVHLSVLLWLCYARDTHRIHAHAGMPRERIMRHDQICLTVTNAFRKNKQEKGHSKKILSASNSGYSWGKKTKEFKIPAALRCE